MTEQAQVHQVVDHLFRHEYGKMVAILARSFGAEHLEMVEDVVQDSLTEALDHWQYSGVPENPSGWLYRVAKNKALNILNRDRNRRDNSFDIEQYIESETSEESPFSDLFSDEEIQDDQLRMIFTCCHPAITPDSQIALALKTLCGFSIPEIARAFLTTDETINKRLVRARQKIREVNIALEVPAGDELEQRLHSVLQTIYLLFNEGYSASKGDDIIRFELCEEAIRLAQVIADNSNIKNKDNVNALLALMFLNASRFKARQDGEGRLLTMAEQNRQLWDARMRSIGIRYLTESTANQSLSIYHILAAISAQYCIAPDYESTDWSSILSLYDSLSQIDRSPVILLNRAIVLAKVHGAEQALAELEQVKKAQDLQSYYLFYSTEAEFYIQLNKYEQATESLEKAIHLAPLQSEKDLLNNKLKVCQSKLKQSSS